MQHVESRKEVAGRTCFLLVDLILQSGFNTVIWNIWLDNLDFVENQNIKKGIDDDKCAHALVNGHSIGHVLINDIDHISHIWCKQELWTCYISCLYVVYTHTWRHWTLGHTSIMFESQVSFSSSVWHNRVHRYQVAINVGSPTKWISHNIYICLFIITSCLCCLLKIT